MTSEQKHVELQRAYRELAAREARLRAILDAEPECVKLLALDGALLEMNPAGLRMIEAQNLNEVQGRCVDPLVVAEHHESFRALRQHVFEGASGSVQFEIVGLCGTRRWHETHASPLRDESGRVVAALGLTRDITRLKEAEQRVDWLNRTYAVLSAANGPEALLLWRPHDQRIALLLTDLVMPGGMSGQQLARQVRFSRPNLKVLFTSGYSPEFAGRLMDLACGEHFVQKPCSPERLLDAVRRCIDT